MDSASDLVDRGAGDGVMGTGWRASFLAPWSDRVASEVGEKVGGGVVGRGVVDGGVVDGGVVGEGVVGGMDST